MNIKILRIISVKLDSRDAENSVNVRDWTETNVRGVKVEIFRSPKVEAVYLAEDEVDLTCTANCIKWKMGMRGSCLLVLFVVVLCRKTTG